MTAGQYLKNPSNSNYKADDSNFFGEFFNLWKTEEQPVIKFPSEWMQATKRSLYCRKILFETYHVVCSFSCEK